MGNKGGGREPELQCSVWVDRTFHMAGVGIWLWEAMEHSPWGWRGSSLESLGLTEARDDRFSVLDIPDAAGCHRRAENEVGHKGSRPVLDWGPGCLCTAHHCTMDIVLLFTARYYSTLCVCVCVCVCIPHFLYSCIDWHLG